MDNTELDRIANRETTWHPLATEDDPPLVLLSRDERNALVAALRGERERASQLTDALTALIPLARAKVRTGDRVLADAINRVDALLAGTVSSTQPEANNG